MQPPVKYDEKKDKNQWYLRYLPFIAKPQHMQVQWLVAECKKNKLSREELLPYVRLLFVTDGEDGQRALKEKIAHVDAASLYKILDAADIYIVPKVIELIPEIDSRLVEIVLLKEMPPYEQKPQKIIDMVFYAVNERNSELLEDVANNLIMSGKEPKGFKANYDRFKAILEDEAFIRTQYPSAK